VGTLSDPEFIRLGAFMAVAVERYPVLEIQLPHEVSGAAFERVKEGQLDASFYYGALTHPSVAALRLREVAYRVSAPAAWAERIEQADWAAIAREPWIMTPPISTHHQLASTMFREHAVEPAKVVEADNETVISSLVVSGLGMALMREEIAQEKAAAGAVILWRDIRLVTTLQFIYLKQRERDPVIHALSDVLKDLWGLRQRDKRPPRRPKVQTE
jgi:DNA-binding transcriptional LysR family regulator